MKKVFAISLSVALTVASLSTYASTEVHSMAGRSVTGQVSVSGQGNLDSLIAALKNKADTAGASEFYVTSAGGKNKLHGSAILLK